MATRKRKGKMSKNSYEAEDAFDTGQSESDNLEGGGQDDSSFDEADIKDEPDSDPEETSASPHGSGIMSLDVLAMVAADRLEQDPKPSSSKSSMPKKVKLSKRSLLNMDFLHLDQIRTLSPKFLVQLFAEMNSNEITRNYAYTCYIMPEKCTSVFTSFGSETKARDLIKSHLTKHIDELVKLKSENTGFSFIAETVVAKKKRELAEKTARRKKSTYSTNKIQRKSTKQSPVNKAKNTAKKFTNLRSPTNEHPQRLSDLQEPLIQCQGGKKYATLTTVPPSAFISSSTSVGDGDFPVVIPDEDYMIAVKNDPDLAAIVDANFTVKDEDDSKADGEWDIIGDTKAPFKRTGRNVERNEKIIWDILCASQPYHDHSYTTVFGKRKAGQAIEEMDLLELGDDGDEKRPSARTSGMKFALNSFLDLETSSSDPKPVMVKVADQEQEKMHIPMVRVEFTPTSEGAAIISAEVMGHSINKPYPPMPRSALAQRGKLDVPEEEVSSSEDDPAIISPSKKLKRKVTEGSLEWERRLALKCIRELRLRKNEGLTRLVCKICKDKTFTATATLMYHYRSHAGIKPFVCLICNTTFTRQHSLNYHMLIHNNQSRFTCVDCGRKFRHPSHFKEHLRRHTGETPFHCMDCPLRFKTRNTYKRHLKTRHGKLLTANGIRIMPPEEFLKVRTKYAKREEGDLGDDVDEEDEDEDEDDDGTMDLEDDMDNQEVDIDPEKIDSDKEMSGADSITSGSNSENRLGPLLEALSADRNVLTVTTDNIHPPVSATLVASKPAETEDTDRLRDTPASNRLLQLCSQVVQQEAG